MAFRALSRSRHSGPRVTKTLRSARAPSRSPFLCRAKPRMRYAGKRWASSSSACVSGELPRRGVVRPELDGVDEVGDRPFEVVRREPGLAATGEGVGARRVELDRLRELLERPRGVAALGEELGSGEPRAGVLRSQ